MKRAWERFGITACRCRRRSEPNWKKREAQPPQSERPLPQGFDGMTQSRPTTDSNTILTLLKEASDPAYDWQYCEATHTYKIAMNAKSAQGIAYAIKERGRRAGFSICCEIGQADNPYAFTSNHQWATLSIRIAPEEQSQFQRFLEKEADNIKQLSSKHIHSLTGQKHAVTLEHNGGLPSSSQSR